MQLPKKIGLTLSAVIHRIHLLIIILSDMVQLMSFHFRIDCQLNRFITKTQVNKEEITYETS